MRRLAAGDEQADGDTAIPHCRTLLAGSLSNALSLPAASRHAADSRRSVAPSAGPRAQFGSFTSNLIAASCSGARPGSGERHPAGVRVDIGEQRIDGDGKTANRAGSRPCRATRRRGRPRPPGQRSCDQVRGRVPMSARSAAAAPRRIRASAPGRGAQSPARPGAALRRFLHASPRARPGRRLSATAPAPGERGTEVAGTQAQARAECLGGVIESAGCQVLETEICLVHGADWIECHDILGRPRYPGRACRASARGPSY